MSRILIFIAGIITGIFFVLAIAILLTLLTPSLLIVDDTPQRADMIVVLGGGASSRFFKGMALYDAGLANQLLLIDRAKGDWDAILREACPDDECRGRKITMLESSTDTFTDAELTKQHCLTHGMKRVIVVTDPYHTRRVSLIFSDRLNKIGIKVYVVSSGDFSRIMSPNQEWWHDNNTMKTIFIELIKVFVVIARNYST